MFLKYKNHNENLQLPIQQLIIKKLQMYIDFYDISYFQLHELPSIRKTYCTLDSCKSLQSGTWSHCISQITSVTQKDITTFYDPKYLWDGNWLQKRSSHGKASQLQLKPCTVLGVSFSLFLLPYLILIYYPYLSPRYSQILSKLCFR